MPLLSFLTKLKRNISFLFKDLDSINLDHVRGRFRFMNFRVHK